MFSTPPAQLRLWCSTSWVLPASPGDGFWPFFTSVPHLQNGTVFYVGRRFTCGQCFTSWRRFTSGRHFTSGQRFTSGRRFTSGQRFTSSRPVIGTLSATVCWETQRLMLCILRHFSAPRCFSREALRQGSRSTVSGEGPLPPWACPSPGNCPVLRLLRRLPWPPLLVGPSVSIFPAVAPKPSVQQGPQPCLLSPNLTGTC